METQQLEEPVTLQESPYSYVYREGDWVYKTQHEFLARNEIHFLKLMRPSMYVPFAELIDRSTIRLEYVPLEPVTDSERFMGHLPRVLKALETCEIRHGDLTVYAIRVRRNRPYLIDFAESRFMCDPRPDKRPEGDEHWLTKSMEELCERQAT